MGINRLAAYWDEMEAESRDVKDTSSPARLTPRERFVININLAMSRWLTAGYQVNDLADRIGRKAATISKWTGDGIDKPNDNLRRACIHLKVDPDSLFLSKPAFLGDIPKKPIPPLVPKLSDQPKTTIEKVEYLLKTKDRKTVENIVNSLMEKYLATAKR